MSTKSRKILSEKKLLRDRMRLKLETSSRSARKRKSRSILKKLFGDAGFKRARTVLFYVSLPGEVDTVPMIARAIREGKKVVVPLVDLENKELKLYEIRDTRRDLRHGSFGVREPKPAPSRRVAPRKIDWAVVPGLAFDRKLRRLGRGAGYFDRFLKRLRRAAPKAGLAFSFQIIRRVPSERHDLKLTRLFTA